VLRSDRVRAPRSRPAALSRFGLALTLLALAGCAAGGAGRKAAPPTAPVPAPGNPGPVYPDAARKRGQEGVVEVEAEVLPTGSVGNARVRTGDEPLASAALEAVRQWQFQPARRDGEAVPARVVIPVRFRIEVRPWRLVATTQSPEGGKRKIDATFATRRACEDAALDTGGDAKGDVSGCVIAPGAPDDAVVPMAQVADAPPAGWVVLLLAPGAADQPRRTAAPLDQWLVVGTFASQRVCETHRKLENAPAALRDVARGGLRCVPFAAGTRAQ
jgi:TonB family protein